MSHSFNLYLGNNEGVWLRIIVLGAAMEPVHFILIIHCKSAQMVCHCSEKQIN